MTAPLVVACPVHGTQAQVQILAHMGDSGNVELRECSLLGAGKGVSCEGRCIANSHTSPAVPITDPKDEVIL